MAQAPAKEKLRTVLALDMGSVNSAITVLRISPKGKPKIITSFMVQELVDDLNQEFRNQSRAFQKRIVEVVNYHLPDAVIAERFLARGLLGSQGEKVSIMIGLLEAICSRRNIPFQLVAAAAWKNTFAKHFGKEKLKKCYQESNKHRHMLDSALIACYRAGLLESLRASNSLKSLLEQLRQHPVELKKRPPKAKAQKKPATSRKRKNTSAR